MIITCQFKTRISCSRLSIKGIMHQIPTFVGLQVPIVESGDHTLLPHLDSILIRAKSLGVQEHLPSVICTGVILFTELEVDILTDNDCD